MNTSCNGDVSSNALSFLCPSSWPQSTCVPSGPGHTGTQSSSCSCTAASGCFLFCSWQWNSSINCMDLKLCGTRKGNLQNPNQQSNLATSRNRGTEARFVSEENSTEVPPSDPAQREMQTRKRQVGGLRSPGLLWAVLEFSLHTSLRVAHALIHQR